MTPSFRRAALALLALATVGVAPRLVAQDNRPTVAVLYFDNNSIGKDRTEYEGIGKGIADLLINDLAEKGSVRVVERDRIQQILAEQGLAKGGQIDQATMMRLGKILQAHYMITGGFMSDGRGSMVLTSRVFSTETSAISNPQKVQAKTDDVLGVIAQLSGKITSDLKLPAMAARPAAGAGPALAGETKVAEQPKAAEHQHEAKPAEQPKAAAQPKTPPKAAEARVAQGPKPKMDLRTALLYSKALDAEDRGSRAEAVELYRAVYAKFPDTRVKAKLSKLGA